MSAVHLSEELQTVAGIISSVETLESDGICVRRPFSRSTIQRIICSLQSICDQY